MFPSVALQQESVEFGSLAAFSWGVQWPLPTSLPSSALEQKRKHGADSLQGSFIEHSQSLLNNFIQGHKMQESCLVWSLNHLVGHRERGSWTRWTFFWSSGALLVCFYDTGLLVMARKATQVLCACMKYHCYKTKFCKNCEKFYTVLTHEKIHHSSRNIVILWNSCMVL